MKLFKRASGVLKDQTSIYVASFCRRTARRNPDIEAAVIKSTTHDEFRVDYRGAQRVFAWVRVSPAYLEPLVWAITRRMEKTGSWVVALKGLMLVHGVFSCKVPAVQRIGRLPFDLSNFKDGHIKPGESWGYNEFIRSYYSFLEQKSSFMLLHAEEQQHNRKVLNIDADQHHKQSSMKQDLVWLQKMQHLLDMLLVIKPSTNSILGTLILEAMDCVVIEIFDVYSRICSGIAKVLNMIYTAGKVEASMALKILQKAAEQGDQLSLYFVYCREIGVMNAAVSPQMQHIPEEDIKTLEHIFMTGFLGQCNYENLPAEEDTVLTLQTTIAHEQGYMTNNNLETIITNQWQQFDEQHHLKNAVIETKVVEAKEEHLLPLIPVSDLQVYGHYRVLPDLISL